MKKQELTFSGVAVGVAGGAGVDSLLEDKDGALGVGDLSGIFISWKRHSMQIKPVLVTLIQTDLLVNWYGGYSTNNTNK